MEKKTMISGVYRKIFYFATYQSGFHGLSLPPNLVMCQSLMPVVNILRRHSRSQALGLARVRIQIWQSLQFKREQILDGYWTNNYTTMIALKKCMVAGQPHPDCGGVSKKTSLESNIAFLLLVILFRKRSHKYIVPNIVSISR